MNPNKNILFLDLVQQNKLIKNELTKAIDEVIDGAQFILGPAVERFEKSFAKYLGAKFCIGLNNGTSALHMALIAADIKPGDEIITTCHTWISTTWAISYVGARPVFVDIDAKTYNLDPILVEKAITPKTKAILPVHLYGQACDMKTLSQIAVKHNLPIIEDVAQSHGAQFESKCLGTIGKMGCFSFYPGKNLGALGEAGAVVTNDEAIADRIYRLRDHAQKGRHNHVEIGFNTRMEGLQGAALDLKLKYLDSWNEARRKNVSTYYEELAGVKGVTLPTLPSDPKSHVWHLFVVQIENLDRMKIQKLLSDEGISTGIHYPTLVPYQPVYSSLRYKHGDFPIAEKVAGNCLSLPMSAEITQPEIQRVAKVLRGALG